MSDPQFLPASSLPHTLSETASTLVSRIPELLRRLRELQDEEAKLDAQAHQLGEQLPETKDNSSTPSYHLVSTPVSKPRLRATVDGGIPNTPPHIGPRNIETPVKPFLLMEAFSLAMSVKSKRKGRIFLAPSLGS